MEIITKEKVLEITKSFLDECGWKLELEQGEIVTIPKNIKIVTATRAYVEEDIEGYTWGSHYQAKVVLQPEEYDFGEYGTIVLYIDLNGELISEDHGRHI